MNINVICVKWGDKYGFEYVNRLYTMVSRNLSVPFTFYCYTDDPHGLFPQISVIDIPKNNDLEVWWNKLALFQRGMFKGTCLFFDVDVVIQKDITSLLGYLDPNKLTLLKTYWKLQTPHNRSYNVQDPKNSFETFNNSSVMLWEADTQVHIWEHFNQDPDYFVIRYAGIDRFIDHESMPVNHFPPGLVYSRAFGTEKEYGPKYNSMGCLSLFYRPEYNVCIFNSFNHEIDSRQGKYITKDAYHGFEKYWS